MKTEYDAKYSDDNYFRYRQWLYQPYIASLISYCRIKPGSLILDVGCGQGFFSHLFYKRGMRVHGIDISEVGIQTATARYGTTSMIFEAGDVTTMSLTHKYDAIFIRSCSLYNIADFSRRHDTTHHLLEYLTHGGVFIFVYNTNISGKRSRGWRYHSLYDLASHFHNYPHKKIFFSIKVDTLFMGKWAFNSFVTRLNMLLSRIMGIGGDAICILSNGQP